MRPGLPLGQSGRRVHRVQLAAGQRLGAQVRDRLVLLRADHVEEGLAGRGFDPRDAAGMPAKTILPPAFSSNGMTAVPYSSYRSRPPSGRKANRFSITTGVPSPARAE